jgi:hypothetical protein
MMRKKRRLMPRHIVLPNGMWRFIKGKSKSAVKSRTARVKTKRKTRRFSSMARRRSIRRYARGQRKELGGIMKLVTPFLAGAGAATLVENTVGQPLGSWTGVAAGAAAGFMTKKGMTGALAGAGGAWSRSAIKGIVSGTAGSSAGNW